MTRSIFAVFAAISVVSVLASQGCAQSGVGDPCIPEQEYDPSFSGFDPKEVNVESKSFQCQTRLCLVNHFRGRVSCPYGQDTGGTATASGASFPGKDIKGNDYDACHVPGSTDLITGNPNDPKTGAKVESQCVDRQAANTVYCSCRCANVDGKTDDGANYCACPDGYQCTQLVSSIGPADQGLTGAYCIKVNTQYDSAAACTTSCDPTITEQNCAPSAIQ